MSFSYGLPLLSLSVILAPTTLTAEVAGPQSDPDDQVIVITADGTEAAAWRTTAIVDVIDYDDLIQRGHTGNIFDVLDELPGVYTFQTGPLGGVGSIRLRGTPSYAAQLAYDGLALTDPSGIQGNYDAALINPAALDQVEVLRGAQSGLYGSRAIGGVVNFRTLAATDESVNRLRLSGGTALGEREVVFQSTGTVENTIGYAFGLSYTEADGISALTDNAEGDPKNFERDDYQRLGFFSRATFMPALPGTLISVQTFLN